MATSFMSVPTERYLMLADLLSQGSLDHAEAGSIETAADYGMACGAILTLLVDFGLVDSVTLQPTA